MKSRSTPFAVIPLALAFALLGAGHSDAQPASQAESVSQMITVEDSFIFEGGTPRQFLSALEKHHNNDLKTNWLAMLSQAAELSPAVAEFVKREKEEVRQFKVDWLSIADIPDEMDMVRLPRLRVAGERGVIEIADGQIQRDVSYSQHVLNGLGSWMQLYNDIGQEKPEIGKLFVEVSQGLPDVLNPAVVMLIPDKASAPEIKVKAFAIKGIPEADWKKLDEDISRGMQHAMHYAVEASISHSRAITGNVRIHRETGLLVATGSESFTQMTESIVEAHSNNQGFLPRTLPTQDGE
ncbi:MAG TPA: hypothetical protein VMS21_15705 [Methylomirabilota bacterium]|nr:hypothetical protein [Methylomirabilota bacterium]